MKKLLSLLSVFTILGSNVALVNSCGDNTTYNSITNPQQILNLINDRLIYKLPIGTSGNISDSKTIENLKQSIANINNLSNSLINTLSFQTGIQINSVNPVGVNVICNIYQKIAQKLIYVSINPSESENIANKIVNNNVFLDPILLNKNDLSLNDQENKKAILDSLKSTNSSLVNLNLQTKNISFAQGAMLPKFGSYKVSIKMNIEISNSTNNSSFEKDINISIPQEGNISQYAAYSITNNSINLSYDDDSQSHLTNNLKFQSELNNELQNNNPFWSEQQYQNLIIWSPFPAIIPTFPAGSVPLTLTFKDSKENATSVLISVSYKPQPANYIASLINHKNIYLPPNSFSNNTSNVELKDLIKTRILYFNIESPLTNYKNNIIIPDDELLKSNEPTDLKIKISVEQDGKIFENNNVVLKVTNTTNEASEITNILNLSKDKYLTLPPVLDNENDLNTSDTSTISFLRKQLKYYFDGLTVEQTSYISFARDINIPISINNETSGIKTVSIKLTILVKGITLKKTLNFTQAENYNLYIALSIIHKKVFLSGNFSPQLKTLYTQSVINNAILDNNPILKRSDVLTFEYNETKTLKNNFCQNVEVKIYNPLNPELTSYKIILDVCLNLTSN